MKYNLVSCGPFGSEFSTYLQKHHSDIFSSGYVEKLTQSDLNNVDALAGFYQFDGLDLSGIKWIHAFAAGIDIYLKQPTLRPDVIITRTLGYMDQRIGEFCLAYMLADLKHLIKVYESSKRKEWDRFNLNVLYDKKVLIYGTGFVSQGVARVLDGLTHSVTGISNSGGAKSPFTRVFPIDDLPDLKDYDFVINTLPLTKETMNFFDIRRFDAFEEAVFINVGRGQSVVEDDLITAIRKGNLRRAILDVFQQEPPPSDSLLWENPAVTITPHHSGLTTFDDIIKSFEEILPLIQEDKTNELFVDLNKGY